MNSKIIDAINKVNIVFFKNIFKRDIKKNIKYLVKNKRFLKPNYFFWPNALILESLLLANPNDDFYVNKINNIWKKQKYKINNIDEYLMASKLLSSNLLDDNSKKELETTLNSQLNLDRKYIYVYRESEPDTVYIDLLGMLPEYLIIQYNRTKNTDFIDIAYNQFVEFNNHALDSNSGLFYHGYNKSSNEKYGNIGWGRGLGWYLYGLSNIIFLLNDDIQIKKFEILFTETINNVLIYKENGMFTWNIGFKGGHLDTSTSSFILYSLLKYSIKFKTSKYYSLIREILESILDYEDEGKITNSSAECGGFGVYPQIYSCNQWSNGPFLSSLVMYNTYLGEIIDGK